MAERRLLCFGFRAGLFLELLGQYLYSIHSDMAFAWRFLATLAFSMAYSTNNWAEWCLNGPFTFYVQLAPVRLWPRPGPTRILKLCCFLFHRSTNSVRKLSVGADIYV